MNLINSIARPAWAAGLRSVTCQCETCRRSIVLRQFSANKVGIRMQGRWYCSCHCFTAAAEKELSQLLTSRIEQTNHVSRMPLGLILIGRGLLTTTQLRVAADRQKECGGEIGSLLVLSGFVTEKQVTAARAIQWNCPVYAVHGHSAQTEIQIPSTLIHIYSAIPLRYVPANKQLVVGFIDGIEYGLLYAVELITGCKTQPCFVTPSEFEVQDHQRKFALERNSGSDATEVLFDRVDNAAEVARILCSYAVKLEAHEATIGKCREYLWARLRCNSREVDFLFKAD